MLSPSSSLIIKRIQALRKSGIIEKADNVETQLFGIGFFIDALQKFLLQNVKSGENFVAFLKIFSRRLPGF